MTLATTSLSGGDELPHDTGVIPLVFLALAGVVAAINFYLSFLRYPVRRLLGQTPEEIRFVSGIPMVGTALVLLAGVFVRQWDAWMASAAIAILLVDTGGVLWIIIGIGWSWYRSEEEGS